MTPPHPTCWFNIRGPGSDGASTQLASGSEDPQDRLPQRPQAQRPSGRGREVSAIKGNALAASPPAPAIHASSPGCSIFIKQCHRLLAMGIMRLPPALKPDSCGAQPSPSPPACLPPPRAPPSLPGCCPTTAASRRHQQPPTGNAQRLVDRIAIRVPLQSGLGDGQPFTFVHLRTEEDWWDYCRREVAKPHTSQVQTIQVTAPLSHLPPPCSRQPQDQARDGEGLGSVSPSSHLCAALQECYVSAGAAAAYLERLGGDPRMPVYVAGGNVTDSDLQEFRRSGFSALARGIQGKAPGHFSRVLGCRFPPHPRSVLPSSLFAS